MILDDSETSKLQSLHRIEFGKHRHAGPAPELAQLSTDGRFCESQQCCASLCYHHLLLPKFQITLRPEVKLSAALLSANHKSVNA